MIHQSWGSDFVAEKCIPQINYSQMQCSRAVPCISYSPQWYEKCGAIVAMSVVRGSLLPLKYFRRKLLEPAWHLTSEQRREKLAHSSRPSVSSDRGFKYGLFACKASWLYIRYTAAEMTGNAAEACRYEKVHRAVHNLLYKNQRSYYGTNEASFHLQRRLQWDYVDENTEYSTFGKICASGSTCEERASSLGMRLLPQARKYLDLPTPPILVFAVSAPLVQHLSFFMSRTRPHLQTNIQPHPAAVRHATAPCNQRDLQSPTRQRFPISNYIPMFCARILPWADLLQSFDALPDELSSKNI